MSFIVRTEPAGHEFSVEPEQTLLERRAGEAD